MPSDTGSPADTTKQIFNLARFAVQCTLAFAAVLLIADFLSRGWASPDSRFLSETAVVTFACAVAAEVVAAIAAATCLALWNRSGS